MCACRVRRIFQKIVAVRTSDMFMVCWSLECYARPNRLSKSRLLSPLTSTEPSRTDLLRCYVRVVSVIVLICTNSCICAIHSDLTKLAVTQVEVRCLRTFSNLLTFHDPEDTIRVSAAGDGQTMLIIVSNLARKMKVYDLEKQVHVFFCFLFFCK